MSVEVLCRNANDVHTSSQLNGRSHHERQDRIRELIVRVAECCETLEDLAMFGLPGFGESVGDGVHKARELPSVKIGSP